MRVALALSLLLAAAAVAAAPELIPGAAGEPSTPLPALAPAPASFAPDAAPPSEYPPGPGTLPQSARAARWEGVWRVALPGTAVSVRSPRSNGGRPVAVHLPESFDATQPARVVTYLHGHGGDIGAYLQSTGVLARIKWLGSSDANVVFVCVEAGAKPFSYWMAAPESFTQLEADALGEAARMIGRPLKVAHRIVSAHSGGGLALRNAVVARQLAADRLEFLDSNYGDWGMVIARWCAAQPHRPRITTWNTPGPTREHDEEIRRAFPALVTVNQSPVGHLAIPAKFLGALLLD